MDSTDQGAHPPRTTARRWNEAILGGAALILLVAGCLIVLLPFIWAVLWAWILVGSTWPLFEELKSRLGGRKLPAALTMTVSLALVGVAPFAIVGWSLRHDFTQLVHATRAALQNGPPQLPQWLTDLPLLGPRLSYRWQEFSTDSVAREQALHSLQAYLQHFAVRLGQSVGKGLFQICVSLLVAFFLYRDGDFFARRASAVAQRLAGDQRGRGLLHVALLTVRAVVYGVLGTALAHALAVGFGLWVTGVPAHFLLAFFSFVLSMVPFGPAMVWLPASLWLLHDGEHGRAIFLLIWGIVSNGVIDSLVRPALISHSGGVPLFLVILGVFGGAASFGFIGVFIGPTLLAVGYSLLNDWLARDDRIA